MPRLCCGFGLVVWLRPGDQSARSREARFSDRWIREKTSDVEYEQMEDLNGALSKLPADQLSVVLLHVHSKMTFQEVAEALQIEPNTAASRYRYALEKLSTLMGDR